MHHRGQLMTMQRMIGQVPHLTRQMQERMAQMAARGDGAEMNFPAETLRFLRALKRNNRREWFNAHRDDYEAYVRQPMTAIVERLAVDLRAFAPELVASPKVSMYRIYRDTRFSDNKTPYKTHVAAVFPTRGLPKHEGAGALLSRLAGRGLDRRRHVRAAAAAALRRPRAHRRPSQAAARDRRVARLPQARSARSTATS